ncbi:hypothetical protein T552_01607 [Pneumocystis carinii B80]|uniref:DNA polymerase alpha subunit B n=1 Tax=Pneumocystis carinii (strain B80) TaxID=1408658 RepID=A0A0W4ZKT5_PNEC8|nr:hypothetical protein T552_01607 [Pneumocystis carinii B80]KTW28976.1 hypothetical protein T552_01607 [Pneumocystis carinii B80]
MSHVNTDTFLKDELSHYFGSAIKNRPEVLMECLSILKLHSISAIELFYRWESWCLKMGNEPELILENILLFKQDMQCMLEKKSNLKTKRLAQNKNYNNLHFSSSLSSKALEFDNILSNIIPNTSQNSKKIHNSSILDDKSLVSMENDNRILAGFTSNFINSGEIMETLNSHILFNDTNYINEKQRKIFFTANFDPKKYSFKTMYQKLSEISEVLDDKIDTFTDELIKYYDLSENDFGNPSYVSHNEIIVVGRIICDSDSEGYLNTTSIILETSRRFCSGSRVLLHIDSLDSYSLFPGQILGVKGINSTGVYFSVHEFLMLPLLPFPVTSLFDFKKYNTPLNGIPQKIFVAAGPYTVDDNILYEPFIELCNKIEEMSPDVVILIGPFLDLRHPLISTGNFNMSLKDDIGSLDDLFKHYISSKIMKLNCLIVIVPHIQDACCRHAAWPQDCFNKRSLGLGKNVKCIPNPAMFSLNEVIIGVSSNDILMSLSKSEIIKSPLYSNTLARLSYHVLQQRHFYPLFPGTAYEPSISGANLDIASIELGGISHVLPDILILPSDLQYFSKVVCNTVVLNPGYLAKKHDFGSYAIIYIKPRDLGEVESNDIDPNDIMIPHNISERVRVDIIKI